MNKAAFLLLATALPCFVPPASADSIVTLGDSLTFAYEAEFGFQYSVFGTTYGDGDGPNMRNWVEILSNPTYRGGDFDLGPRRSIVVTPPYSSPFNFYFRQDNNWAIPGLGADGMRRFVLGEAGFTDLIAENPSFAKLAAAFTYSNFNESVDFSLADFENEVAHTANRLTIFIGGNDIHDKYADIYNDDNPGTFVVDFMANITAVMNRVQALNPTLPIVLVAVPHVGIAPAIRANYPYDPVKTGRITAVLKDLNGQLAALAEARKIGFADIFTPTLGLIDPDVNLCIEGVVFKNLSSSGVNPNRIWVNGQLSANIHPVTNAQAIIANEIVNAFNRRYHSGLKPLTATEILVGLTGKSAADADMSFADWMTNYGLTGGTAADDSDGDGISAGVEFATGLNPTLRDADLISSGISGGSMELAYPNRISNSSHYTLESTWSADLISGFSPVVPQPGPEADGLSHARLAPALRGFLRLEAVVEP